MVNDVLKLYRDGDYRRAILEASRLAGKFPNNAELQFQMGKILQSCSALEDAVVYFRRALSVAPDRGDWNAELTGALISLRKFDEAREAFDRGMITHADHAPLLIAGSLLEQAAGTLDAALDYAERAYRLAPELDYHAQILLQVLQIADPARALEFGLSCIEKDPGDVKLRSIIAVDLLYNEEIAEQEIARIIREVGQIMESQIAKRVDFPNRRDAEKKLRIGILSADLRTHSVAFFLMPFLRHLPRSEFELYFYPLSAHSDHVSKEIKKFGKWVDFKPMNALEFNARIRNDQVDVLIETGGMTAGARPEILAMQPAPVQISMIGFPHGLGLSRIDARIGDAFVDLPNQEEFLVERIFRVDSPFLCYEGFEEYPALTPRADDAPVVFCSMNSAKKIGIRQLLLWKKTLDRIPNSRLLIKCHHPDRVLEREGLARRLDQVGIVDRVHFLEGTQSQKDHRSVYLDCDIALDTFPYNGTTTTIEALLMGVPVLTLRGEVHRSRVSAMMLTEIGYPQWIADTEEEYILIAEQMARKVLEIRSGREQLRSAVEESELMNGEAYAQKIGVALRSLWREYCSSE